MSYVEIYILRLSALVPQLTVTKNSELIHVAAGTLSNYGGDLVLSFHNRQDIDLKTKYYCAQGWVKDQLKVVLTENKKVNVYTMVNIKKVH